MGKLCEIHGGICHFPLLDSDGIDGDLAGHLFVSMEATKKTPIARTVHFLWVRSSRQPGALPGMWHADLAISSCSRGRLRRRDTSSFSVNALFWLVSKKMGTLS
jgi:hypothetical protein